MHQKLKSFLLNDTIFTVTVILLVGIASFGLGRQSVLESSSISHNKQGNTALKELQPLEPNISAENTSNIPVVVSRSGTKYHLLDCPGALQMKEENKIKFDSIKEAVAAGYAPAGNCSGI